MLSERYYSLVEDVKQIKPARKQEPSRGYWILKRYDVLPLQCCEKVKLNHYQIKKKNVKLFIHVEELFEILYSTHLLIRYG